MLLFAGLWAPTAHAQRPQAVKPHLLQANVGAAGQAQETTAQPHYDVVALRVEFQPDTTRFTTGDGTFGGTLYDDGLAAKVDPLPHDAAYFQAHLAFLSHYVDRVSDGQTQVTTHVIPEVVRVSQPMAAYSPTGFEADSDEELRKLAALVEEAWTLADQQTTFDPSRVVAGETAFVLFHAGVGRDIELIGTTLDKTPQDLPSLFFDGEALTRLGVDGLTYKGLPLDHTIVLPRTESRQGFDFINDEAFLIELSINGLLAASFFNYLGIPDLFDTDDGTSAIGPFGLMDPLGIFAFNGLFPPEPMAWTKEQLGWATPQFFSRPPDTAIVLQASSVAVRNDVAIVRANGKYGGGVISGGEPPSTTSVNTGESFWVENRYRDPEGDGLILQVWRDGLVREQRIENGDSLFNSFTQESFIGGVVVGVDNYDWALPGGVDEDGNPLNGGVLIWHIDAGRLAEALATNTVNADPARRGIDLEEADSGQDLGNPSGNPLGPQLDLGSPFDFYYAGNPVEVITQAGNRVGLYENRFGPGTYPSSEANAGGPSFVVLEDFSAPAATMTFTYRYAEAVQGIRLVNDQGSSNFITNLGDYIAPYGIDPFEGLLMAASGLYVATRTGAGFTFLEGTESSGAVVGRDNQSFRLRRNGVGNLAASQSPYRNSATVLGLPGGTPLRKDDFILQGNGANEFYTLVGDTIRYLVEMEYGPVIQVADIEAGTAARMAWAGSELALVDGGETRLRTSGRRWQHSAALRPENGQPVFGQDASGPIGMVPVLDERSLVWLFADGTTRTIALDAFGVAYGDTADGLNPYPILADLDGDGHLDVMTTYGTQLLAFTQGGASVAGFPIALPAPSVTQPLVAELTESGGWTVLASLLDGTIRAYDLGAGGRLVPGFPLTVGDRVLATPLLHEDKLYAIADKGPFMVWEFDQVGEIWWGKLFGNAQNQSYVEVVPDDEPAPGAALIDATETYNWPNPVRDGRTRLRVKTEKPSTVRITIIDGSGRKVDEVEMANVPGGVPTEVLWTANVQSGIYYARVRARATDGSEDTHLYKIAVLR